ncbi:hypothetical protein AAMO2058_001625300 [Amorphochlora amoebiformis]
MLALPRRSFSRRSTWPRVASVAALALCVVGYFMSPSKVLGSEAKGVRRSQSLDMSRLASMERLERLGRLRGGDSDLEKAVVVDLESYGKESAEIPCYSPIAKKTKIVSTLGPACSDLESLKNLLRAGANIFRLNASHRRPGQFETVIKLIRQASEETGLPVEILGDLQGPKFRVSEVSGEGALMLKNGEEFEFAIEKDSNDKIREGRITMKNTVEQVALIMGLEKGMKLLINDGAMELEVIERIDDKSVKAKVLVGGKLTSRKGVNVPQLQIACSALTAKDIDDAKFLLNVEPPIDYVALSFVQKRQDVQDFIDLMDAENIPHDKRPKVIPKIEKPQALENIDEIMSLAHGLMVARGDLGVECGMERVPFAQKLLIRKANLAQKFVITATQMLESMNDNAAPTRAEVSDVANAVFDGTNAVMTSAETSTGRFPVRTIETMSRVLCEAERTLPRLASIASKSSN